MKLSKLHSLGLLAAVLGVAPVVNAQPAPRIFINGSELRTGVEPVVESNRVLVPLRAIFEQLGATVDYDRRDGSILARRSGTRVEMEVDSTRARVNGEAIRLDVPATTYGGRTMVPLRFVSEALGAQVNFDTYRNTVTIEDRNWRDRNPDRPGRDRPRDRDDHWRDRPGGTRP